MERRTRVALFLDTFYPMIDGVITVVDNYARRLSPYADVTVFVPRVHNARFDDGTLPYRVVRCGSVRIPFLDYSLPLVKWDIKFRRELKKFAPDVIHIHSPFPVGIAGINYAKKHGIPVVASLHSQFRRDFKRAVGSELIADRMTRAAVRQFERCDECWAVNAGTAELYEKEYRCRAKIKVTPNATDMLPVPDPEAAKKRVDALYGIGGNEKVLLFVGRINELKNVFLIADSLKILKEKYGVPFRMLFVGTGQDEERLRERIVSDGLDCTATMCGSVTDRALLADIYCRADLFLFPSYYDSSSLVQIEAASQHTPTVFAEGSVTSCGVRDGVDGFIAAANADDFASAVANALTDGEKLKRVSQGAFDGLYVHWDDRIKQIYESYEKLIKR